MSEQKIEVMIGKTFTSFKKEDDLLAFKNADTEVEFLHEQDCCEGVRINDITGDLEDLIGTPIVDAYETSSDATNDEELKDEWGGPDSATWTFYHFRTNKGNVCVRWLGLSNGYYSEGVDVRINGKFDWQ